MTLQTLMLIYVGIDSMAWLVRPIGQKLVKGPDFIKWVEEHFPAPFKIKYQGVDLFAARCGVVHGATSQSKLSDDGQAREIYYTWGVEPADEFHEVVQSASAATGGAKFRNVIVLRIDDLFEAYTSALASFMNKIEQDARTAALVEERSKFLFRYTPTTKTQGGPS